MQWTDETETVVTDHRVDGVPTLVLANKQDAEGSMAVEDIKQMFNQLIVEKLNVSEGAVMPISALKGSVQLVGHRGKDADGRASTGTEFAKQSTGSS